MTEDAFTCPACRTVSHHPRDLQEGYCGRCCDWTAAPEVQMHRRALIGRGWNRRPERDTRNAHAWEEPDGTLHYVPPGRLPVVGLWRRP